MGIREKLAELKKRRDRWIIDDPYPARPEMGIVVGIGALATGRSIAAGDRPYIAAYGLFTVVMFCYQVWWLRFVAELRKEEAVKIRKIRQMMLEEYKYDPEDFEDEE